MPQTPDHHVEVLLEGLPAPTAPHDSSALSAVDIQNDFQVGELLVPSTGKSRSDAAPLAKAVQSPSSSYGSVGFVNGGAGNEQSIAHEVGMLSLPNAADPKYLGPSSGLIFARALTGVGPSGQGLSSSTGALASISKDGHALQQIVLAELPALVDLQRFINAYFETFHPLYPFLNEADFLRTAESIRQTAATGQKPSREMQNDLSRDERYSHAQVYLVLFLGATLLEFRLGRKYNSSSYMATAMMHMQYISLHDNLRGLQTILLLILASLQSPRGMDAWFLRAALIAGCIDLGLQRKVSYVDNTSPDALNNHNLRSGIFWSTYSIDRTLSVLLGRPLTLRDEAFDIGFPDDLSGEEISRDAVGIGQDTSVNAGHNLDNQTMVPAITSFRFDRIVAEIKLMLHRVSQSPARFPWPTKVSSWQTAVHEACSDMIEQARKRLNRLDTPLRYGLSSAFILAPLDLKYHHTIMLLYRPSPLIPQPSALALRFCFESAMETIRIYSDMYRNGSMTNSYLEAHTIFVSGISICYCLLVSKNIRQVTPANLFTHYVDMVKQLLSILSQTWAVAKSASEKFGALAEWTEMSFKDDMIGQTQPEDVLHYAPTATGPSAQHDSLEIPPLPFNDDLDWENMVVSYDNTEMLPDELREIPDWFTLSEWLDYGNDTGSG